jgi:hypothetical protein
MHCFNLRIILWDVSWDLEFWSQQRQPLHGNISVHTPVEWQQLCGCHVTEAMLTHNNGTHHAASPNTSPVAKRWRNKHISMTALMSRNNRRTFGSGVFCWVPYRGCITRISGTSQQLAVWDSRSSVSARRPVQSSDSGYQVQFSCKGVRNSPFFTQLIPCIGCLCWLHNSGSQQTCDNILKIYWDARSQMQFLQVTKH